SARCVMTACRRRSARGEDNVRRKCRKLCCVPLKKGWLARGPSIVDLHIPSVDPTQRLQSFSKRLGARNRDWVIDSQIHQGADAPRPLTLLRTHREGPYRCCTAKQCDKLASPHSHPSQPENADYHTGCRRTPLCAAAI